MSALRRETATWVVCVMVLLSGAAVANAQYGGGTGTEDDPYLIYTAEQLNAIGAHPTDWGCCFKLMADIDLSAYAADEFNIIGADWNHRFTGVFDGNGYTIANLTYSAVGKDHVGLFGYVHDVGAEIRNLGLIDARVESSDGSEVGGLVGYLNAGTVTNCYVRGATVSAGSEVGGLIGNHFNGTIRNCYASGTVTATGREVGGLAGSNQGAIVNCYATGVVSGSEYVGGLAGRNSEAVADCYASTVVVGDRATGGLIGHDTGSVSGAFWDIEASGQATSAGGAGRTTVEMQDPNTFIAAGWDFFGWSDGPSDIWTVGADAGYPILWWELPEDALPELPTFSGGSGIADDPYRIASAEELAQIGHNPRLMASHFRLVSDIDLAGVELLPIGSAVFPFAGSFDGNHRVISNFTRALEEANDVGFFRYVADAEAILRNLTLADPNVAVETGRQIGALVGYLADGTVANCHVQGGHVRGTYYVGGLVGLNSGTIRDCSAEATVSAEYTVGGLAGSTRDTVANCHAAGTVTGQIYYVGGLVGAGAGIIRNCSAGCAVVGDRDVGGLVGFIQDAFVANCYAQGGSVSGASNVGGLVGNFNIIGTIMNCYASCPVSGTGNAGGLVGRATLGFVTSSFWNTETSGQATSAAGVGKTTAEMADPNTFIEAGWDLFGPANGPSDIWTLALDMNHPVLWWQVPEETWPTLPSFSGGTGTPEDPYLIDLAEQLGGIGHNPRLMGSCFKLTSDIDLTDTEFVPLGGLGAPFAAVFDGNDRVISNLALIAAETGYAGLFGFIDGQRAQVRNLTLLAPHIDGDEGGHADNVGALAGYLRNGTLLNCRVEGGSIAGDWGVGGLAGSVVFGTVRDCHTTDAVAGSSRTGGLLGECHHTTITDCSTAGAVTGSRWNTGGLVGSAAHAVMRNCHATGIVTGTAWTGGLVGDADRSAIAHCYATGDVSGGDHVGGLTGDGGRALIDCHATGDVKGDGEVGGLIGNNGGIVTDCYATGAVAGNSSVGGLIGHNWSGVLHGSHAGGTVDGSDKVGGLVGMNDTVSTVTCCGATGAVSGESNVGGLTGYSGGGGTSASCRATGTVSGQTNVGGLVGYNDSGSTISDCYGTGSVLGLENVGGLVGRNGERIDVDDFYGEFPGFIVNCYSTGCVSGQSQAGGLVGLHGWGSVDASFWDLEASGQATSAAGIGKTTAEMQQSGTFLEAGWDFVGESANGTEDIWWILEGQDYPRLWWESGTDVPM